VDDKVLDTPMDYASVRTLGADLGSASVIVIDDTVSLDWVIQKTVHFFAHESCGKCTPCREGTYWMRHLIDRAHNGGGSDADVELLLTVAKQRCRTNACARWEVCTMAVVTGTSGSRRISKNGRLSETDAQADHAHHRRNGDHGTGRHADRGCCQGSGIDIPVFCYHPKMEPVGMCRMCLVEVGRPMMDRTTGRAVLDDDGQPKLQFGPKLETACTTPISDGMMVLTKSEKALAGQKSTVEFLLTSHPLDCPVCDKGGECPLQNLTMAHGPGESRSSFDEKMRLEKNVPLSELIYLDEERCIQCGRCVRFQDEIAGDPVLSFDERGRSMRIVSLSEPGFDSVFSGNTTDICPVGALTTADFRFGARPWELTSSASICGQCPVGCNITFNTRREAGSDGRIVVKRVMPRQNEEVNEIWICDKGRFAYHYGESQERLSKPLVRKDGKLARSSWMPAADRRQAILHAACWCWPRGDCPMRTSSTSRRWRTKRAGRLCCTPEWAEAT
jgi:ferredoxin